MMYSKISRVASLGRFSLAPFYLTISVSHGLLWLSPNTHRHVNECDLEWDIWHIFIWCVYVCSTFNCLEVGLSWWNGPLVRNYEAKFTSSFLNLTTLQVKILLPCEERGEMQFCHSSFVHFAIINFLYLGKYLCKKKF